MQLSDWLSFQSSRVRNNVKIVEVPQAYHISSNLKIKRFMPMIGNRMDPTEDRTIPRVCCGETVLNSIRGHAAVAWDQLDAWFEGQFDEFAIYEMPFKQYLAPNKKLVFDAEYTHELWVVPHDATTVSFKADIVGHFMMEEYLQTIRHGEDAITVVYVVRTTKPVVFDRGIVMDGYYRVSISSANKLNKPKFESPYTVDKVEKITSASYNAVLNKIKRAIK